MKSARAVYQQFAASLWFLKHAFRKGLQTSIRTGISVVKKLKLVSTWSEVWTPAKYCYRWGNTFALIFFFFKRTLEQRVLRTMLVFFFFSLMLQSPQHRHLNYWSICMLEQNKFPPPSTPWIPVLLLFQFSAIKRTHQIEEIIIYGVL